MTEKKTTAELTELVEQQQREIDALKGIVCRYLAVMFPRGGTNRTDVNKSFFEARLTAKEREDTAMLTGWFERVTGESSD